MRALLDAAAAPCHIGTMISAAVQLAAAGGYADIVELLLDCSSSSGYEKPSSLLLLDRLGMGRGPQLTSWPRPLEAGTVLLASANMGPSAKWDSLLRCASPGWLEQRAEVRRMRRKLRDVVIHGDVSEDEEEEEEEKKKEKEKEKKRMAAATQTERILAAMVGGVHLSSIREKLARGGGGAAGAAVAPLFDAQKKRKSRGRQLSRREELRMQQLQQPLGQRQQLHALETAAAAGSEDVVGLFLRQREVLDIQAEHVGNAFVAAAANGHVQIVQQLMPLLDGADGAETAASKALEGAVRDGHARTVEFLLEYGAAPGRADEDVQIVLENIASAESATCVLKLLQLARERDSEEEKLNELHQKALCLAAEHGNVVVLESILSSDVALDNGSFAKAMYAACRPGHTAAVLALINSEAGKLLESDDVEDCLLVAAHEGHAELAPCLLPHLHREKATEVLTRCVEAAAGNDHLACTQVLMAALTEEEDRIRAARCAFATAAQNGHADMVRFLLERGADPEKGSMTHAMKECINRFTLHSPRSPCSRVTSEDGWKKSDEVGTRATVRMLLEHGADANAQYEPDKSVLHTAAQNCPVKVVEWLIEHGADVKAAATGPNSVFVAVAGRELDSLAVMELLFQAGGQLEPSGESIHPVLAKALEFFDGDIQPYYYRSTSEAPDGRFELTESIRYVLEQGPGALIRKTLQLLPAEKAMDSRYGLLLQMAAADADNSLIELLLARGVDVNAAGFYYGTALQAAARHGHAATVSLLLAARADVNALQGRYHTPLRAAAAGGHTAAEGYASIVRTLLMHGAGIARAFATETDHRHQRDLPAASTLRLAVERGHFAAAAELLFFGQSQGPQVHADGRPKPLLAVAAARNDERMVEMLVAHGTEDVNVRGQPDAYDLGWGRESDAVGALHAACAQGHVGMVRALLRLGADVDAVVQCERQPTREYRGPGQPAPVVERWDSKSPLAAAVWCGVRTRGAAAAAPVVRELLAAGADVNKPSGRAGRTPLCEAAEVGDVGVVEMLVEAGAALYVDGAKGNNPLGEACASGHLGVVEYLMEKICGTDVEQAACADGMRRAAKSKMHKAMELLLEFVPANQETLLLAAMVGLPSLVRMVLDAGVHVDAQDESGHTALLTAVYNGNPAVVRILLECGANARMKTPWGGGLVTEAFCRAVWEESWSRDLPSCEEVIRLLVESGADVEDEGPGGEANDRTKMRSAFHLPAHLAGKKTGSALQLAAYLGREKTVALLLDNGADVNRKCGSLDTPLWIAVERDHAAVVQLLLERGADCRQVSKRQDTLLCLACRRGSNHCMRLLLRHGADPNARSADHATPLTLAIKSVVFQHQRYPSEKETCLEVFLKEAPGVRVTEADLLAAAGSLGFDANLRLLLDHFVKNIPVSEAVIARVLGWNCNRKEVRSLIRDLLEHANGIGITATMVQSARDVDTLDFLLTQCSQHHPVCAITPAVLEGCHHMPIIFYLLQHDERLVPTQRAALLAVIDTTNYTSVTSSGESKERPEIPRFVQVMRLLWERNPRLHVSRCMLQTTKEADALSFLLARAEENNNPQELVIDQDTVIEVVMYRPRNADRLRVLLEFRPDLRLDNATVERLVEMAMSDLSVWAVLLKSQPQLVVTEEVFRWTRLTKEWVELMRQFGKDVVFTDKMRRRVEMLLPSRSQAVLKELVFSLEREERDDDEAVQRH